MVVNLSRPAELTTQETNLTDRRRTNLDTQSSNSTVVLLNEPYFGLQLIKRAVTE